MGPHTIGPKAKPYDCQSKQTMDGYRGSGRLTRTKREVPRIMTSSPTWNCAAVTCVAVLKTELPKVIQKVINCNNLVTVSFHYKRLGLSLLPIPRMRESD